MRESGPHKVDEDGDDDGDVDEDDHRGDDSPPDGSLAPPRRGGEVLPLVLPPPWTSPWMGRGSPPSPWPSWR